MVRDRGRAHRSAGLNLDCEHAGMMPGRPPPDPSLRDAADVAIEVGVDATVGLSAAEAAARLARDGIEVLHLEVRLSNGAARALYESEGWVYQGLRQGYYRDGESAALYTRGPT